MLHFHNQNGHYKYNARIMTPNNIQMGMKLIKIPMRFMLFPL